MLNVSQNRLDRIQGLSSLQSLIALNAGESLTFFVFLDIKNGSDD